MIRFVRGNILASKAQTLVNMVNCVGVMGKGLAKEFRDRYPRMYEEYKAACRRGEVRIGHPFLYREIDRLILCFPTKDNWKGPSKYEFIEAGLLAIRENYGRWGIESLAVSPLGCGLGGLEWDEVKARIERTLADLPIDIEVYGPMAQEGKVTPRGEKQVVQPVKITLPLALLGELVRRALAQGGANARLGKLLVQKFAFFAQVAGAPLRLRFDKYKFGPYDHRINHMVERLEGLYLRDESPSWNRSELRFLDETAWTTVVEPLRSEWERYVTYLDASVRLLSGRSVPEVELLATVQYAWCSLVADGLEGGEEDVIEFVHDWSKEKREKFTPDSIRQALRLLGEQGWLGPSEAGGPSPLVDPVPEAGQAVLQ